MTTPASDHTHRLTRSEPAHHPDAEMLLAYATGGLDPATSLIVAAHAALCPVCAAEIRRYEMIGGALMESLAPAEMDDGALAAVLAIIEGEDGKAVAPKSGIEVSLDPEIARLPAPVREIAAKAASTQSWKSVAPGIKTFNLDPLASERDDDVEIKLIRLEPGKGTPRHTHKGDEFTLVLTGAFSDETGRYGVGDLAVGTPDIVHRPIAEPGEVCIALAVTNAPLRFTGTLGWVQRALGGGS